GLGPRDRGTCIVRLDRACIGERVVLLDDVRRAGLVLLEQLVRALLRAVAAIEVVGPVLGGAVDRDLVVARMRDAAWHRARRIERVRLATDQRAELVDGEDAVALELVGIDTRELVRLRILGLLGRGRRAVVLAACKPTQRESYETPGTAHGRTVSRSRVLFLLALVGSCHASRRVIDEPELGNIRDRFSQG